MNLSLKTLTVLILMISYLASAAQDKKPLFKVLVLAESGGHHIAFTKAAKPWLDNLSKEFFFDIDYIENTSCIDDDFLNQYKLFIQLDYPPYGWSD